MTPPNCKTGREESDEMRLDKWLWAARFFKTRQAATDAINGGKVQVNGQRSKPGRTIQAGCRVSITLEPYTFEIEVLNLDRQRRSAPLASKLYQEFPESLKARQEVLEKRREQQKLGAPTEDQRPNKRERRLIHRFKRQDSVT